MMNNETLNDPIRDATEEVRMFNPEIIMENAAASDQLVSFLSTLAEKANVKSESLSKNERYLVQALREFFAHTDPVCRNTCVSRNVTPHGGSARTLLSEMKCMWVPVGFRDSTTDGSVASVTSGYASLGHLAPSGNSTGHAGTHEKSFNSFNGRHLVYRLPPVQQVPADSHPSGSEPGGEGSTSDLRHSLEKVHLQLGQFNHSSAPELKQSVDQLKLYLEDLTSALENQGSRLMRAGSPSLSCRGQSCQSQSTVLQWHKWSQCNKQGADKVNAVSDESCKVYPTNQETEDVKGGQRKVPSGNKNNILCDKQCWKAVDRDSSDPRTQESPNPVVPEAQTSEAECRSSRDDGVVQDGFNKEGGAGVKTQQKRAMPNLRKHNMAMRRLVDSMQFDLNMYARTAAEQSAMNATLHEEATFLREREAEMWMRLRETEFCEMARIEMRLKREDLRELESEVRRLHLLHDRDLVKRKRNVLLHSYRKLLKFGMGIADALREHEFCTGTLESQRRLLIDEAGDLTREVSRYIDVL
uniref:Uncharacterized protein TCIL3000_10_750 n=1 Tax=Trypanosoma congolense (strain IL3000) TaxID=1068625 RepID=G0UVA1_TRYCI|nr:unnamed protein product [Trypanosoma congolense IL3000]